MKMQTFYTVEWQSGWNYPRWNWHTTYRSAKQARQERDKFNARNKANGTKFKYRAILHRWNVL